MKLYYQDYELPLICYSRCNIWQVEGADVLYNVLYQLALNSTSTCCYSLSINNIMLEMSKHAEFVDSPFQMNLNSSPLLNRVYSYYAERVFETGLDHDIQQKIIELGMLIDDVVISDSVSDMVQQSPSIKDVFKFFKLEFNNNHEKSLVESMCDYMLIKRTHDTKRLFIFPLFSNFLNISDMIAIESTCKNEDLYVLFVESEHSCIPSTSGFRHTILDKDLCQIVIHEP